MKDIMTKIEYINKDNLKHEDIDEVVTRVKCFIVNKNGECILISALGGYQLPGGHVEEGEDIIPSVKREIMEETGIVLDEDEIPNPFLECNRYSKNHKQTGKNRNSKILYFFIETEKDIDKNNLHMTEHEKENNFNAVRVPIQNLERILIENIKNTDNDVVKAIEQEMLDCYAVYKSL